MSKTKTTPDTVANPATAPNAGAPRHARTTQLDPATIAAIAAEDEWGVDYGPAIEALDDLLGWAFELARKDVAGWPEGTRRVRSAHRFARAVLRGKTPRTEPREDLLFTAALLVRVFEADLGLAVDQVVSVLDQLGLPLDHVPITHAVPAAPASPPITPSTWRHLRAIYDALSPSEAEAARHESGCLSAAEREAWIAELSHRTVDDGARLVSAYLRGEIELAPRRVVSPPAVAPRVVVGVPASVAIPRIAAARGASCGCGLAPSCFRRTA